MFLMLTIAALCAVVLGSSLISILCRSPKTASHPMLSDDILMCFISPALIVLVAFGIISAGWRFTHGGLSAISIESWVGAIVIVALSVAGWIVLSRKIRA